jgi:hypothetical protein
MDDLNLEPLEPEEIQVDEVNQSKSWIKQAIVLGFAALLLLIILGIGFYFLFFSPSDELVAQPVDFNITNDPGVALISVFNRGNRPITLAKISPVYYGREQSSPVAGIIDAVIESDTLPRILNPEEVRLIRMTFHVEKKDLDACCRPLTDSSHAVIFQDGPPKGQLEGDLGLAWQVSDADGKSYSNNARLFYYTLVPSPPGLQDTTLLIRSGLISLDPFELCTQGEAAESK